MITMYGILDFKGCHIDTSKTLQGAKNYATINKHNVVSKRVGYNAVVVARKLHGKWISNDNLI